MRLCSAQTADNMSILILKDGEITLLQTGLGKLFSNLSFLSFQLGNLRHIRKISFFHQAGGGTGHNGELCNKRSDVITTVVEVRKCIEMVVWFIPQDNLLCVYIRAECHSLVAELA